MIIITILFYSKNSLIRPSRLLSRKILFGRINYARPICLKKKFENIHKFNTNLFLTKKIVNEFAFIVKLYLNRKDFKNDFIF